MAGFHFQRAGLPFDGAGVALTSDKAIGAALAKKQGYRLTVLIGDEGDV